MKNLIVSEPYKLNLDKKIAQFNNILNRYYLVITRIMEVNKTVFNVNKTETHKTSIILENIVKMISSRMYVDKGKLVPMLDPGTVINPKNDKGENTYVFKSSNGSDFAIKIIYQTLTTIGKQSPINEFIKDYPDHQKIFVVKSYSAKIYTHVTKNRSQIFKVDDLLENILDYSEQPKFELLTPEEMNLVRSEYNVNDYTLDKMGHNDPIARYFGLKKGDVIKIIRPSETSGIAIAYRVVFS